MTTPATPAADAVSQLDNIMGRAAKSVEAAARRSADAKPWEELVQRLAAALNCLPSSFVDGNEHLFKAIATATDRESALVAERDALKAALLQAARDVEDLKKPCHMDDPESRQAIRNSLYMSIAAKARGALADISARGLS